MGSLAAGSPSGKEGSFVNKTEARRGARSSCPLDQVGQSNTLALTSDPIVLGRADMQHLGVAAANQISRSVRAGSAAVATLS